MREKLLARLELLRNTRLQLTAQVHAAQGAEQEVTNLLQLMDEEEEAAKKLELAKAITESELAMNKAPAVEELAKQEAIGDDEVVRKVLEDAA